MEEKNNNKKLFLIGGFIVGILLIIGMTISITLFIFKNQDPAVSQQESLPISKEEAENIALEAVSGNILYTTLDNDDGEKEYEVYIQTDSVVKEVTINAHTGVIEEIDVED